jgi:hypothetical protein
MCDILKGVLGTKISRISRILLEQTCKEKVKKNACVYTDITTITKYKLEVLKY